MGTRVFVALRPTRGPLNSPSSGTEPGYPGFGSGCRLGGLPVASFVHETFLDEIFHGTAPAVVPVPVEQVNCSEGLVTDSAVTPRRADRQIGSVRTTHDLAAFSMRSLRRA